MSKSDDSVKHLKNDEPVLISEFLHEQLNINYENFKSLIKLGAIYIDNYRQTKDKWVLENSIFRIHTKPRRYNCNFDWNSLVVFENESFLVLNKPSGVPSHPSVDNSIEDSLTQTSLALKIPLYVTHRLDSLTSGLIVYGKRPSFVREFNIQLIERKVGKKYVALVESEFTFPKMLTHYMDPAKGTPKKLSDLPVENWDECRLEILSQKKKSVNLSWVKINLMTGRTHQIRSQMAFMQAPIVGDTLYGSKQAFSDRAIALKSCEIEFFFNNQKVKYSLDDEISVR